MAKNTCIFDNFGCVFVNIPLKLSKFTFIQTSLTKKISTVFMPVVEMSTPLFEAGFRLFIDGGYKVKPELLF